MLREMILAEKDLRRKEGGDTEAQRLREEKTEKTDLFEILSVLSVSVPFSQLCGRAECIGNGRQ